MPNESKGLNPYQIEAEKIVALLEEAYQDYQKEKPTRKGLDRWNRFSRPHCVRLHELCQLRDAIKGDKLHADSILNTI